MVQRQDTICKSNTTFSESKECLVASIRRAVYTVQAVNEAEVEGVPAFSSYSALLIYFKVEPHNGVQHPAGVLRTGRRRESEHWRLPSSSSSLEVDQQPNAAVKGRIPF